MAPTFKPKILVVDDEPEARMGLAHGLRSRGYEVLEAATGREVFGRAKQEWPSLIILDVLLPDLPGTEVFEQLRADPVTKAIPVLLLTGKPEVVERIPAFKEKTSRHRTFEKPGRVEDLLKVVHEMLTGKP